MENEMGQPRRFQDPLTCAFIELLGVNKDVTVR
jgi:hypothetical protein